MPAKKKRRSRAKQKPAERTSSTSPKSVFAVDFKPRVDLRLAYGSITEVDAEAVVLGLFQGVQDLPGATSAVDQRLGGAITDFIERRMFSGRVGEVFIFPAVRQDIRAELVILAGMGRFDRFDQDVLEIVAENVARTLVRAKVSGFAMALFGASRSKNLHHELAHLIDGFFRGVSGSRQRNPLRSITVCETSRQRCDAIEAALGELYQTRRSEYVDVTLEKLSLPEPLRDEAGARAGSVILQATQQPSDTWEDHTTVRLSVLARGAKATALSATKEIDNETLHNLVQDATKDRFVQASTLGPLETYGKKLTRTLVPPRIARVLKQVASDRRIVVMHDRGMSRVPWETLYIDGGFPAGKGGMSRQYLADDMPMARWLEERRYGEELDLLLIVNPTKDLRGAVKEGEMVEKVARGLSGVKLTRLFQGEATKERVKEELQSGQYDVLHYAGHTAFWPEDPDASGILCAHHEVLSGGELGQMKNLPALVFFNSCESARVGWASETGMRPDVGLAESFLRGGVANYVGTHWEVSDAAAPEFVKAFYSTLLERKPIGAAVANGRAAVRKLASKDWADYIHYGSPDFVLKFPYAETGR